MKIYSCLMALFVVTLISQLAYSWGPEGHETVALIAQQILQNQSKKNDSKAASALAAINTILGQTTIDKAATWPDEVKLQSRTCTKSPFVVKDPNYIDAKGKKGVSSPICDAYQATAEWHFATINADNGVGHNQTQYSFPSTVVMEKGKLSPYATGDLVLIIKGLVHILRNENAPILTGVTSFDNWKQQCEISHSCKKEALEFLIHFLGDIHQPLHAGASCDVGGNSQYIRFFGQSINPATKKAPWCEGKPDTCANYELHEAWDTTLLVFVPGSKADVPANFSSTKTSDLMRSMAIIQQSSDKNGSGNKPCVQAAPGLPLSDENIDENTGPNNGPINWVNESACYFPQAYTFPDPQTSPPQAIAKKGKTPKRSVAQAAPSIPNLCDQSKKTGTGFNQKFTAFDVDKQYYKKNIVTINERLYWAGSRLANILKYIYGDGDKVQGELR